MSGRNQFVFAALTLMILLATGAARAQQPVVGVDGCAILAILVYTEVTEAGFRGARAPGDSVYPGPGEITICNQTTRSVTAAFSSSLRNMNIYVSWGYHPGDSGDYCLSHFLSQCYPDRNPNMPPLSATQRNFVAASWSAIYGSVSRAMATAPGADISRFDRAGLSYGIRSRLAMNRTAGVLADTRISD